MTNDGPPGIGIWLGVIALSWSIGFVGVMAWLIVYTIAQRGIIP